MSSNNISIDLQTAGNLYILYGTTQEWALRKGKISNGETIYVYTDYFTDEDGVVHPAIKIGDGKAYIDDLPFVNGPINQIKGHIQNKIIHITQLERERWNNNVTCEVDDENLIFSKGG